ncbi:MAG TPA: cupin domain-containing protein [Gemmatimonadales bacterium]|nr:cupin domain-containing protein [Gemmatimonadales bacterium]
MEPSTYPQLTRIDLGHEADAVMQDYKNWVITGVNDHCVRLAVMVGEYLWHLHPHSDECFLVLRGQLDIDIDAGTVHLGPGDLFTIPAGVRHRTRAHKRCVNVCFEHATAYADAVFDGEGGTGR